MMEIGSQLNKCILTCKVGGLEVGSKEEKKRKEERWYPGVYLYNVNRNDKYYNVRIRYWFIYAYKLYVYRDS